MTISHPFGPGDWVEVFLLNDAKGFRMLVEFEFCLF